MHLKLFKAALTTAVIITSCSFSAALKRQKAEDEQEKTQERLTFTEKYTQKNKELENMEDKILAAYNKPARINPEGKWDFNIFGSLIYWEARENDLTVANMYDSHGSTAILSHTQMKYEYKPGFKVGMGMNVGDHDNWVLNMCYTRLHDNYTASMNIPSSEVWSDDVIPGWLSYQLITGYSFLSSKGTWTNDLNWIDVNLGRPFYSGEKLCIFPYIGMRSGWMDQKYAAEYTATTLSDTDTSYNFSSNSKQDSWLIGPRATLVSDWHFAYGLKLRSNLAAGLYYQDFKNTFTDYNITGIAYSHSVKKHKNITFNYEIGLAFGYSTYFASNKGHIDIAIGYDFQMFTNQNSMKSIISDFISISDGILEGDSNTADLALHGLTVSARFDF